ncbi:unnamed protein product [Malus baccata var. baccata]
MNITMAGKRKRIHCDFSSKASIANPQIRVVVIVTSNSRVDAVITSGNTQGSANEEAQQNKHEDVTSQEERKFLCDRYASVQFKNAINRSHLNYNHKAESKSFRAHEYETVRRCAHKQTKNGWDEGGKLKWGEMIGMKNDITLPDGIVTLTDGEFFLEVLGHKSRYFKGPSKFHSFEDSMLSKHLEERVETQQQELVTTKQELVETKEELGEAKQEIQELKENQKKFEELLHKIMEGQQPPP